MTEAVRGQEGPGEPPTPRPPRVRVTAWVATPAASDGGTGLDGPPVREAGAVYVRSLRHGQLRLAIGSLFAFLLVAGAYTAGVFVLARVDEPVVFGVPLSWLLQAYGYYPIILSFAVVFARSASRNERRFRALTGHGTGHGTESPVSP